MPIQDSDVKSVDERLARIEMHLIAELGGDGREGNLQTILKNVVNELKTVDGLLRGNSVSAGIITRLDRLEQTEIRRLWSQRALWGAVLAAIIAEIMTLIR